MPNRIVWVDIPVLKLDRAIRFYSAVLKCGIQKHEGPGFELGVLPHEGQAIGGCLVTGTGQQPSDHGILVYLNCDGRLDDAVAAVVPLGGKVVTPPHSIAPQVAQRTGTTFAQGTVAIDAVQSPTEIDRRLKRRTYYTSKGASVTIPAEEPEIQVHIDEHQITVLDSVETVDTK